MSPPPKKPRLDANHPAVVDLDAQAQALIDQAFVIMAQRGQTHAITIVLSDVKNQITVYRTNVEGAPAAMRGYLNQVLDDIEGISEDGYTIKPFHPA